MPGFRDPITDGNGQMVIDDMHSENFETGFTGWQLTKAGDAEFNNVVTRGELSTAAAPLPRVVVGGGSLPTIEFYNDDPVTHIDGPALMQAVDDGLIIVSPSRDIIDAAVLRLTPPNSAANLGGTFLFDFSDDLSGRQNVVDIEGAAGILCPVMRPVSVLANAILNTASTVFVPAATVNVNKTAPPSGWIKVHMDAGMFNSVATNRTEVGYRVRDTNAAGTLLYDGTSAIDTMGRTGTSATYSTVTIDRLAGPFTPGANLYVEMMYRSNVAGTASIQVPSLIVTPEP